MREFPGNFAAGHFSQLNWDIFNNAAHIYNQGILKIEYLAEYRLGADYLKYFFNILDILKLSKSEKFFAEIASLT